MINKTFDGAFFLNQVDKMNHSEVIAIVLLTDTQTDTVTELFEVTILSRKQS